MDPHDAHVRTRSRLISQTRGCKPAAEDIGGRSDHVCCRDLRGGLAASGGGTATHASVAASVANHDGAAGSAAWRIAHVIHIAHGIGRVIHAAIVERGTVARRSR